MKRCKSYLSIGLIFVLQYSTCTGGPFVGLFLFSSTVLGAVADESSLLSIAPVDQLMCRTVNESSETVADEDTPNGCNGGSDCLSNSAVEAAQRSLFAFVLRTLPPVSNAFLTLTSTDLLSSQLIPLARAGPLHTVSRECTHCLIKIE